LDHRSFAVVHVQSRSSPSATQTLTAPVSIFPLLFLSVGSRSGSLD
jgi:hypothetical protein